jgi:hypothetical protein
MTRKPVVAHLARAIAIFATLLLACSEKRNNSGTATRPSPNASILPAPLASAGDLAGASGLRGATSAAIGIPADSAGHLVLREPEPPPPEPLPVNREIPGDTLTAKDGAGYSLEGAFHWADVPAPPAAPEVVPSAIREASQKTELSVAIDLASVGRLRFSLESAAFPLPTHTELRARSNYYGHVLVWPDGASYRLLAPGSLRAMFAERRADVTPLLRAKVTPAGTGTLLGHKTIVTDVETSQGTLTIEQTTLAGSGGGGELLCRLLVEIVGAEPNTETCRSERIPLAGRYRWAPSGSLSFNVTSLAEKKDLALGYVYVPPAGAVFAPGQLPPKTSGVFLTQSDLAKFRLHPTRGAVPGSRAPGEGITADNQTNGLVYLLLDGVAVACLGPRERKYVIGPPAGRYSVAFRDFFGTILSPPSMVELPAFVRNGAAETDGGARP